MAGIVRHATGTALLLTLAVGGALAATDPTRPPAAWLGQGGAVTTASGGPRLQSVLMPERGKPVAVIAGQTVPLGTMFGAARLVRLTEREAVLHEGGGNQPRRGGARRRDVRSTLRQDHGGPGSCRWRQRTRDLTMNATAPCSFDRRRSKPQPIHSRRNSSAHG
jgi:hypothetical protein